MKKTKILLLLIAGCSANTSGQGPFCTDACVADDAQVEDGGSKETDTSDGTTLLPFADGAVAQDAEANDAGIGPSDGSIDNDSSQPQEDAATPLAHELFVGTWSCTDTTTTNISGVVLDTPMVTVYEAEVSDDYSFVSSIGFLFDHFEDDALYVRFDSGSRYDMYVLHLVDEDTIEGVYTHSPYPKIVTTVSCVRK